MRNHQLFTMVLLACYLQLPAQSDTSFTTIRQENTPYVQPAYADPYQTIFRSLEPARLLFKWNALALWPTDGQGVNAPDLSIYNPTPNPRGLLLDVAAEVKISPGLSFNFAGSCISGRVSPDLFLFDYIPNELTYGQLRFEPRFYFDMPRQIDASENANNFSGNYFGIEITQSELFGQSGEVHIFPERENTATLRFGVQRRLFRFGYFDFSYGIGWRRWEQKNFYPNKPRNEFFANSRIALGIALAAGTGKHKPQQASWCDITRCFREENHMWRISLLKALVMDNAREFYGELPVAFEQKIAASPYSVEAEGILSYGSTHNYRQIFSSTEYIGRIGFGLAVEPRYYFTQKKRIAQGRSGDNLSGPFLAFRLQGMYEFAKIPDQSAFERQTWQLAAVPVFGIQYRLLRNGFIAYKIGVGLARTRAHSAYFNNPPSWDVYGLSEVKVGVAF